MSFDEEKVVDLRVRRTRHLLQQAFMELLKSKGFQAMTVQDIAERAMVNRATFYDHFVDKYDLMERSINQWFKETLRGKVPAEFTFSDEHLRLLVLTTCEFLHLLRHHCLPRDQQLLPMVQTQITTLIGQILVGWLTETPAARPDAPAQLAATVTSWAIYGAAAYWSQEDRRESAEEFVAQAMPTILASLSQAIHAAAP